MSLPDRLPGSVQQWRRRSTSSMRRGGSRHIYASALSFRWRRFSLGEARRFAASIGPHPPAPLLPGARSTMMITPIPARSYGPAPGLSIRLAPSGPLLARRSPDGAPRPLGATGFGGDFAAPDRPSLLHHRGVRLSFRRSAGVAQWQSRSFPSLRRGFDSLHPLHLRARKHDDEQHGGDHCEA